MFNLNVNVVSENSSHYVIRCPFCGDSRTESHGHLYVSKSKPVFRCVKCGKSGHVYALLEALNIPKTEVLFTSEYLNSGNKSSKQSSMFSDYNFNVSELYEYQVEYFKNRLGVDPSDEFRMIPHGEYMHMASKLKSPVYSEVIPFLTYKKRKMIARILDKRSKFRYWSYSFSDGGDCYIIGNKRKYSSYSKHKTIVLAEGIFDIISVYTKKLFDIPEDSIYVATLSKAMSVGFSIAKGIALADKPNVILCIDNDTDYREYIGSGSKPSIQYDSIKVFRNTTGKDFGEKDVSPELIYQS